MNCKKLRLGLVGKDVSKSESERIHRFILSQLNVACEYEKFSIPSTDFDNTIHHLLGDFDGFNITIPYKRDVMEYLDDIQGDAVTFSAVNTVVCARRAGYNTDGVGFLQMLTQAGVQVKGKKTLVLGGGGSGRSSAKALQGAGADVYLYQRNQEQRLHTCQELRLQAATPSQVEAGGFDVIVNCTGVGMHDTEGKSPVSLSSFNGAEWAIDLIYTPPVSEFLRQAAQKGVKTLNGASMLFYQAYYADCIFLNLQPSSAQAIELYEKYLLQK